MAHTGSQVRRLLISAFGINSGGGLVLLKALVKGAHESIRSIELDARVSSSQIGVIAGESRSVRRSFLARFVSSARLARSATEGDVLLCFNSLPPLVASRAKVVTYVHAPHFVGAHKGIQYAPLTRMRLWIERAWFRMAVSNTDEAWVQTSTMANRLREQFPSLTVRIVPLVDESLYRLAAAAPQSLSPDMAWDAQSFFYPADTVGHKNHVNLLRAWALLAAESRRPKLWLTLSESELDSKLALAGLTRDQVGDVLALGRLSRNDVLARLASASALIFPSVAETFGLPMLEAGALGRPIVASERDFVRDVCRPVQSFDPDSPFSIARAVTRFVQGDTTPLGPYFAADQFVEALLS